MGFEGFSVALTGLFTSQRALDVVNHNVANAAKEGYSRQVVEQGTNMPISIPNQGMLGQGTTVEDIARKRNELLDYKYWSENYKYGNWDTKNSGLKEVETIFSETTNTGVTKTMNDFYSALQSLTKNPSDMSVRGNLRETATTFTKTLNSMAQRLYKEQKDLDTEVVAKVDQVNSYADQIAVLNKQIFTLELNGHTANDLRDQRTVLIDKLSKLTNIDVKENTDSATGMKKMYISIGGNNLVGHCDSYHLEAQRNQYNALDKSTILNRYGEKLAALNASGITGDELKKQQQDIINEMKKYTDLYTDPPVGLGTNALTVDIKDINNNSKNLVNGTTSNNLDNSDIKYSADDLLNTDLPYVYSITWEKEGTEVNIKSGDIKGLLDLRDGDGEGQNYRGVAYYIKRMDEFAQKYAENFNSQHEKGYTNENPPKSGVAFFGAQGITTPSSADLQTNMSNDNYRNFYKNIKASNIKVSDDITNDLNNIAASDSSNGGTAETNNAKNILSLINQRNDTLFFSGVSDLPQGKPDDFFKAVISSLAVDSQQAGRMNDNQNVMVKQVNNRRSEESSVDQNEEMANAVQYQQTYMASAKMINVMDGIYDTIINRLGLVGR